MVNVLTVDVETTPILAYTWGLWNQNIGISQIKMPTFLLSYASKRNNEKTQFYGGPSNASSWKERDLDVVLRRNEMRLADHLAEDLDWADIVVGWNSQKFDIRHINRVLDTHGYGPPSPFKQVDVMKQFRKNFYHPSNKLDYAAQVKLGDHKTHHEGFGLWLKCMEGDEKAWKKMERYNIHDVDLTYKLFKGYQGWYSPAAPNFAVIDGQADACPKCGGTGGIQKRGLAHTSLGSYQRYQHTGKRGCGAWLRGKERVGTSMYAPLV